MFDSNQDQNKLSGKTTVKKEKSILLAQKRHKGDISNVKSQKDCRRGRKDFKKADFSVYLKNNDIKPKSKEFCQSKDAFTTESIGIKSWFAGSNKVSRDNITDVNIEEQDNIINVTKKESLPSSYRIPRKRSLEES